MAVQQEEPTMFSLALRTQPEAKLLQAAWCACIHSLPGGSHLGQSVAMGVDSDRRSENVKGLP